ncbi:VOC family protein [Paenibacillus pasadenensis]|uniref:glyoxalase superfamily protein n=1 Tax=Paenibacillus pasadenensis TaxID=217090 RepID=UPI00203ABDCA|nr:glyoxalase superfamily protein [Paenibacillus pasadenensis]MCM3750011.1 VOC family protein [Paenibacillus pasadenensis]
MNNKRTIPILRSFDESKAKEFYVGFLGGTVLWEHRFEEGMPLYMAVELGGVELHLSEHHGDGSPGANVRIEMEPGQIRGYQAELLAKRYTYARPGLEKPPWGGIELSVGDPSGNRLTFYEPKQE